MNDMLNVDKYRKEIIDYMNKDRFSEGLDCKIAALRGLRNCENCECDDCLRASLTWLFSEYEPPLLENGDDLKPGDWIMVRDHHSDKWNKKPFLCYKNGCFITANDGYIGVVGKYEAWKLARLPEDGE